MKYVEEIIIAFVDGEMTEVEFWRRGRDKSWGYKTYNVTRARMTRLLAALKTACNQYSHYRCYFSGPEGDMTLHIGV